MPKWLTYPHFKGFAWQRFLASFSISFCAKKPKHAKLLPYIFFHIYFKMLYISILIDVIANRHKGWLGILVIAVILTIFICMWFSFAHNNGIRITLEGQESKKLSASFESTDHSMVYCVSKMYSQFKYISRYVKIARLLGHKVLSPLNLFRHVWLYC